MVSAASVCLKIAAIMEPSEITLFLRKLTVEEKKRLRAESPHYKSYKYITTEDFRLPLKGTGDYVEIPKGFLSDGCSGPGYDRWGVRDWILHDWLYFSGGYMAVSRDRTEFLGNRVTRKQADGVFRHLFFYRRWCVRLFGKKYWNRNRSVPIIRDDILLDKQLY